MSHIINAMLSLSRVAGGLTSEKKGVWKIETLFQIIQQFTRDTTTIKT